MDDTILVSNNLGFLQQIKKLLSSAFDMVDLGELHSCLGIQIQRDCTKGILLLRQSKFIEDTIKKFGLESAHSATTPYLASSMKSTSDSGGQLVTNQPYANLVGCL